MEKIISEVWEMIEKEKRTLGYAILVISEKYGITIKSIVDSLS